MQKMLRFPQVQELTGLTRSTIYEMMFRGEFPKQVKVGPRSVAWVQAEVEEWLSTRLAQRCDQQAAA